MYSQVLDITPRKACKRKCMQGKGMRCTPMALISIGGLKGYSAGTWAGNACCIMKAGAMHQDPGKGGCNEQSGGIHVRRTLREVCGGLCCLALAPRATSVADGSGREALVKTGGRLKPGRKERRRVCSRRQEAAGQSQRPVEESRRRRAVNRSIHVQKLRPCSCWATLRGKSSQGCALSWCPLAFQQHAHMSAWKTCARQ